MSSLINDLQSSPRQQSESSTAASAPPEQSSSTEEVSPPPESQSHDNPENQQSRGTQTRLKPTRSDQTQRKAPQQKSQPLPNSFKSPIWLPGCAPPSQPPRFWKQSHGRTRRRSPQTQTTPVDDLIDLN